MIDLAIRQIAINLNQYLKMAFDLSEDVVAVSNLVEQDGSLNSHIIDKLIIFLVKIDKVNMPLQHKQHQQSSSTFRIISPNPNHFNLFVMFAAHFPGKNYLEALKFLSKTISFFQKNPTLDHQNTPDLDEGIDKLILDIENLDIKDLSNLWGVLSGKYLPSILYRVRMVTFDSGDVSGQVPLIQKTSTKVIP